MNYQDGRTTLDDYAAFNDVWDKPAGGLHAYLFRFLSSQDATFQHIAVWTMVQFLESGGMQAHYLYFKSMADCRQRSSADFFHT
jgi:vacuolar protein 8